MVISQSLLSQPTFIQVAGFDNRVIDRVHAPIIHGRSMLTRPNQCLWYIPCSHVLCLRTLKPSITVLLTEFTFLHPLTVDVDTPHFYFYLKPCSHSPKSYTMVASINFLLANTVLQLLHYGNTDDSNRSVTVTQYTLSLAQQACG